MFMRRAAITLLAIALPSYGLLVSCSTGPVQTNNPVPPSVTWVLYNTNTGTRHQTVPAGMTLVDFINPGDNYDVAFWADEAGGIKTITLSATGTAICSGNHAPYTMSNPFNYSIPSQTVTLQVTNGQAYTHAAFPYYFNWQTGVTAAAVTACGANVPMLGTTIYKGKATNFGNTSTGTYNFEVHTCASGSC
jgi:hypothetical protein